MRYEIRGTRRSTGKKARALVEAQNESEASGKAEQHGLVVESVVRLPDSPPPGDSRVPPTSSSLDADSNRSAALWGSVHHDLDRALTLLDQQEGLPDTAWLGDSKESHQKLIDTILDAVIAVLGSSAATDARAQLRHLDQELKECKHRQAEYRREHVSAPSRKSLNVIERLYRKSAEEYEELISDETRKAKELETQAAKTEQVFEHALSEIGINSSVVDVGVLAKPVTTDDFVSMAAIAISIGAISKELERQVDLSKEAPAEAKRYYGMVVVLLYCLDRVQQRFTNEIEAIHIPRLHTFAEEARQIITDAQRQIHNGGPANELTANVEAGQTTIDACDLYVRVLDNQRQFIGGENQKLKLRLDAARNTYRTVRVSLDVADLINNAQRAFQCVRELRLPEMRIYQNLRLKQEWNRLTERLLNQ